MGNLCFSALPRDITSTARMVNLSAELGILLSFSHRAFPCSPPILVSSSVLLFLLLLRDFRFCFVVLRPLAFCLLLVFQVFNSGDLRLKFKLEREKNSLVGQRSESKPAVFLTHSMPLKCFDFSSVALPCHSRCSVRNTVEMRAS